MSKGQSSTTKNRLTAVVFAGERSPYGAAHLRPFCEHFDVRQILVASDARWKRFRQSLSGKRLTPKTTRQVIEFVRTSVNQIRGILQGKISPKKQLANLAREFHIPLLEIEDANGEDSLRVVQQRDCDILLSAAFPQIFSQELLEIPRRGAVNFHPSLLPMYRGAHPHYWAVVKGEQTSGITSHYLTPDLDQGDIIAQIEVPIDGGTYTEFCQRVIQTTPELVEVTARNLNDNAPARPQRGPTSVFRENRTIHSRVFWQLHSSDEIHNLVRGGQAFCFFADQRMELRKTSVTHKNRNMTNDLVVPPGTIVDVSASGIVVATKDAFLVISDLRWKRRNWRDNRLGQQFAPYIGLVLS